MENKFYVRIGNHVVNTDNVASFELDGVNLVEIWYVGSATPLVIKPPVPAQAFLDLLTARNWLF